MSLNINSPVSHIFPVPFPFSDLTEGLPVHLDTASSSSVPAKTECCIPSYIFVLELNFVTELEIRSLEKDCENLNCAD